MLLDDRPCLFPCSGAPTICASSSEGFTKKQNLMGCQSEWPSKPWSFGRLGWTNCKSVLGFQHCELNSAAAMHRTGTWVLSGCGLSSCTNKRQPYCPMLFPKHGIQKHGRSWKLSRSFTSLDCTQQMEHQEQQQQQNNNKTTKKHARNHILIYPLMQQ